METGQLTQNTAASHLEGSFGTSAISVITPSETLLHSKTELRVRIILGSICEITGSDKHFATLAITSANHVYVTNKMRFEDHRTNP